MSKINAVCVYCGSSPGTDPAFEQAACAMPAVQLCVHLSGKWDFILHIAVRNQQDYYDWLMQELFNLPNIEQVESSFALKEAKTYGPFEL